MMISERKASWSFIVIMTIAIVVLLGVEQYAREREYSDLWSISFVHPNGDSLEFHLTNRSPNRFFTVTVSVDEEELGSREMRFSDEQKSIFIAPEAIAGRSHFQGTVKIRVTDASGNTRELWKRIE